MSVCIEHLDSKNNFSQQLPAREALIRFPQIFCLHTKVPSRKRFKGINAWMSRSRQRKQLARLDQRMLHDIGISTKQAQKEYNKPFWK